MNLIQQVFLNQMTEDGLAELRRRYPLEFMDNVKMSNDDQFKDARKIKTERNKLVKALNDKRISFTGEVKSYSDSIVDQINEIYDPIVIAFDEENAKRKEVEAEKARKLAVLLDEESRKIQEIKRMVDSARNATSEGVQDIIEAVDLIDTSSFHKDLIHEAIETKETVLSDLAGILSSSIASEKVEEERAKLKIESDKIERTREIDARLNTLRMMPSEFFGKPSQEMIAKIHSLESFEVKEADFDERTGEVIEVLSICLNQLKSMLTQAVKMEEFEAKEKQAKIDETKEIAKEVSEIDKVEPIVDNKKPEEQESKPAKTLFETAKYTVSTKDCLVKFLTYCSSNDQMIEHFGYLLLSSDEMHNKQALDAIKDGFTNFTS